MERNKEVRDIEKYSDMVRQIVREERDKEREIRIVVGGLDAEDYQHLRKDLKKRLKPLMKGLLCIVKVTDDEDLDIRQKEGW